MSVELTSAEMTQQGLAFIAAMNAEQEVRPGSLDPRVRAVLIDLMFEKWPELAEEMLTPERAARLELMRLGIDPWAAEV